MAKIFIFHGISRSHNLYVKHCETAKLMLDKLQSLYLGGKLQISKMEKNTKDSTHTAVVNQASSQNEDEIPSDSNDQSRGTKRRYQ